jgi:hypothetical protein
MPSKRSQPRPLEFRLSLEAAERINQRIQRCQLPILQTVSHKESKLKRLGLIANAAIQILEAEGYAIEGCSDEAAVSRWLNRERGKELTVFKALCQAVDENWVEAFDRQLYKDILVGEQSKTLETFTGSFFSLFVSSEQNEFVLSKYQPLIEQVIGSPQSSETITTLFETFLQEFAFNGRQIRFRATSTAKPCPITAIEIVGRNQNGILETWSDHFTEPYPNAVEVVHWWWKGEVTIQFQVLKGNQVINKTCRVLILSRGYIWADVFYDCDRDLCHVK